MSRKEMDEKIESKLKRGLKPNGESSQVERSWKHKKGASLDLNVYPGRENEKQRRKQKMVAWNYDFY